MNKDQILKMIERYLTSDYYRIMFYYGIPLTIFTYSITPERKKVGTLYLTFDIKERRLSIYDNIAGEDSQIMSYVMNPKDLRSFYYDYCNMCLCLRDIIEEHNLGEYLLYDGSSMILCFFYYMFDQVENGEFLTCHTQ